MTTPDRTMSRAWRAFFNQEDSGMSLDDACREAEIAKATYLDLLGNHRSAVRSRPVKRKYTPPTHSTVGPNVAAYVVGTEALIHIHPRHAALLILVGAGVSLESIATSEGVTVRAVRYRLETARRHALRALADLGVVNYHDYHRVARELEPWVSDLEDDD